MRMQVMPTDASSVRRSAILQNAFSDPLWKASLLRLRTLHLPGGPFVVERELALWQAALDSTHVDIGLLGYYRANISTMDLGWYQHLAMESLYHNAGVERAATAESRAA